MDKIIKKHYKILIILLLASILRLFELDNIPPHLRNDEASLGYNGYSILKTGKDEHGQFLPIIFQSFGDWKPGLYIYLTVPFVAIFGLNEFSVRLPSAIFGIFSVWLIYEITAQIFANRKLALISGAVFALSPLHITFSRGGWEVNVALSLTLAAILFFLKAANGKKKLLLLSALFFGLTLFSSHTAKLSSPAVAGILVLAYFKQFRKIGIRIIGSAILIGLTFTVPIASSFIEGQVLRITTLSIFPYYPDPVSLFQAIATRWFSLYSTSTLFIRGDTNPQHTPPSSGPLLLVDSLFLAVGIIKLIRYGTKSQNIFIWLGLILLSLPSALTIEKANFERILPMFIPVLMIIALGIGTVFEDMKNKIGGKAKYILVVFISLYLLNYIYFLDQYFIHGPKKNDAWQYGYKQIVEKVIPVKTQYDSILIQQSLEHPYIFFLFYQKYDPVKYQQIVKEVFVPNKEGKDMGTVLGFENIRFADINWEREKPVLNTLYIMPIFKLNEQSRFYKDYQIIDEVDDLNGFPLFKIVKI